MKIDLLYALSNRSGSISWHEVLQNTRRHAVMADELGFDTIWFGEHHFDVDGTDASPNPLMLATDIAARTHRIRIGTAATVLTLWHPIRVAEDIALADHFSEGRLDVAFARGILPIEVLNLNPKADRWTPGNASQEIFDEHLDIIRGLWARDPFSWEGKHYTFPVPGAKYIHADGANKRVDWVDDEGRLTGIGLMPRPFQTPHPPLFSVTESESGFRNAARRGLTPITWYPTGQVLADLLAAYRDELAAAAPGPTPQEGPGVLRLAFVAETDEEAKRICAPAVRDFARYIYKVRGIGVWLDAGEDASDPRFAAMDPWDLLMDRDHLLIGSPTTVADQMKRLTTTHDIGRWLIQTGFPGISGDDVDRSIALFGEHVLPVVRDAAPVPTFA